MKRRDFMKGAFAMALSSMVTTGDLKVLAKEDRLEVIPAEGTGYYYENSNGEIETIVFHGSFDSATYTDGKGVEHEIYADSVLGNLYLDDKCIVSVEYSAKSQKNDAQPLVVFGSDWSLYKSVNVTYYPWDASISGILYSAVWIAIGLATGGMTAAGAKLTGAKAVIDAVLSFVSSSMPVVYACVDIYKTPYNCYRNRSYHYKYANHSGYTGYVDSDYYDYPIY